MEWYLQVLKKYADFKGRARRKEYWMFCLINIIILLLLILLDNLLLIFFEIYSPLSLIYILSFIVPSTAVAVRRLHDIGKSGWNLLFGLIPIVGVIILIVWYCTDGEVGTNKWGENPKKI